jgi:hypothetical protein
MASVRVHRKKKVREFLVTSREVTNKLSLGGNNDVITELFLPRGSLVSDIPAGDGKLVNLFFRCSSAPKKGNVYDIQWYEKSFPLYQPRCKARYLRKEKVSDVKKCVPLGLAEFLKRNQTKHLRDSRWFQQWWEEMLPNGTSA